MTTSEQRAEAIMATMRILENDYPDCETIQLLGIYLDNHVEDTLEREEESHNERLNALEKVVIELRLLGHTLSKLTIKF